MDPVSTHLILLQKAIDMFDGDIIECGCGLHSTKFFHELSLKGDRKIYSLESDKGWLFRVQTTYPPNENHKYIEVIDGNWQSMTKFFNSHKWAVVFIDHENHRQLRGDTLRNFIGNADSAILHDTEDVIRDGNDPIRAFSDELFSNWKHREDDTSNMPNTTLLYN